MSVTISRSTGHRLDNLPFFLFAAGGSSLGNTCRNSYKRKERRPSLCFLPVLIGSDLGICLCSGIGIEFLRNYFSNFSIFI